MQVGYTLSTPSKLIPALIAAKAEMGPALKDSHNPHFKSAFVSLQGALDACMPALHKHGLDVIQYPIVNEHGPALVTQLVHSSGETIVGHYPLAPAKQNDPQSLGAAMTYARRYGLMAITGMAPEDDDGNMASGRDTSPPKAQTPTATSPMMPKNSALSPSSAPSSPAPVSSAAVPKPAGGLAAPRKIQMQTMAKLSPAVAALKLPDDAQLLRWLREASGEPSITGLKDLSEVGALKALRKAEAGEV